MATVPSQRTWNVGDLETAAYFNSNIRDAVNFLLNPPAAEIYSSTATSLPNATFTTLTLGGVLNDTDTMTSTANQLTIKTAGTYLIGFNAVVGVGMTAGTMLAQVLRNGTSIYECAATFNAVGYVTVAGSPLHFPLAVNDVLTLQAYQSSGGTLNCGGTYATHLFARRVGA